jgi:hypothetical protein
MWKVILVTPPIQNDFRSDYFPRFVRYKHEAERLQDEVTRKGGVAIIKQAKIGETK